MADFVWTKNGLTSSEPRMNRLYKIKETPLEQLAVYGNTETFHSYKENEDFVFALGDCYRSGRTTADSLRTLLRSFAESGIGAVKSEMLGQYILIIKKRCDLFIFSDFMQVRHIFYSPGGDIVSSSYISTETALGADSRRLDKYKVFEFLVLGQISFPGWLGTGTLHKDILRLQANEYIKLGLKDGAFAVGAVKLRIDNEKRPNKADLAEKLVENLKTSVCRDYLREECVGANITGGYDTRLVAAIAAGYYAKLRLRIGVSKGRVRSLRDLRIAKKIADVRAIPLDVFYKDEDTDDETFYDMTEGFCPPYNASTTSLICNTDGYALGLGGLCGTQLFVPLAFRTVDEFTNRLVGSARRRFPGRSDYIERFSDGLTTEFRGLAGAYDFREARESDLIRMYIIKNAVSYGSFIHASFNIRGLQCEPYLTRPVIEIAFEIPDRYQGDRSKIGGIYHVPKAAMARVDYQLGKITTFAHFDPMLPLSFRTGLYYGLGYLRHIAYWSGQRVSERKALAVRAHFDGFEYSSYGRELMFLRRLKERYDEKIEIRQLES